MKNLETYILEKKQIKLFFIVVIYSVLSVISGMVGSRDIVNMLEPLNIPASTISIAAGVLVLPISLLALVVLVNAFYLVIKICLKIFENKEIEDKKYLKKLLYLTSLFTGIISAISSIIVSFLIGNSKTIVLIISINEIFVGLISLYMQFIIIRYYLNTEKIHKVLPLVIYISTVMSQIINVIGL